MSAFLRYNWQNCKIFIVYIVVTWYMHTLWKEYLHPLAFFVKTLRSPSFQPVFTALLFIHAAWAELIHCHSFTYHMTWPSPIYHKLPQSYGLKHPSDSQTSPLWVPYAFKLQMSKIKLTSSPPKTVLFIWSLSLVNDCSHMEGKNLRSILGFFLICETSYLLSIPSISHFLSIFTYSLCEAPTSSSWTILIVS